MNYTLINIGLALFNMLVLGINSWAEDDFEVKMAYGLAFLMAMCWFISETQIYSLKYGSLV